MAATTGELRSVMILVRHILCVALILTFISSPATEARILKRKKTQQKKRASASPSKCPDHLFQCKSRECIMPKLRCDGHRDCLDGSDEHDCKIKGLGTRPLKPEELKDLPDGFGCPHSTYQCANYECVMAGARCDGVVHCSDGTDEKNCKKSEKKKAKLKPSTPYPTSPSEDLKCPPGYYQCKNKECIAPRSRCDEQKDCNDGSDEEDCDKEDPMAADLRRMDEEVRQQAKQQRDGPHTTTARSPTTTSRPRKTSKKTTKKKIQTTTPFLPDNIGEGPDLTDEEAQNMRGNKRKTDLRRK